MLRKGEVFLIKFIIQVIAIYKETAPMQFLGGIRAMGHNANSKAKSFIEQNCLRAVPDRMQGCAAKLSMASKNRLSTSLPADVRK